MLKSREEYVMAKQRIEDDRRIADRQRERLQAAGVTGEELDRMLEPLLTFHAQLAEEVEWFDRIASGDFSSVNDLEAIGRLIIALRLAQDVSQEELAARLGITVEQVIRDERDEYYGFTKEEINAVLVALGVRIQTTVVPNPGSAMAFAG